MGRCPARKQEREFSPSNVTNPVADAVPHFQKNKVQE
jgi:hypothetical protein